MFNTNDKKFIHFEVDKSLISNQFNYNSSLKDSNGVIYFGSINGLCYFHPDMMNLNEPNSEPSIYISDLSISGHQIHPTDPSNTLATTINNTNEIIVSHRDNTIELDFLAVSMVKTGKSMFYIKYKMDGIDNSWHERDNSPISVTYANMRSGKYTFDISLYNEFGVEIDSRRILIIIKVHPLLRWYMLLIYAILICLLIIYTINISNDSIKARLEATYEHLEKQNIIEINKQKLNFFTHISHEFRTPISILSTIFNENNQDQQHNLISQQDITIAINNTRKLRFLINQLMDFREIENEHGNITLSTSDIIKFLRNSFNLFTPVAKLKSINYLFDTNIESYTMQFDDDKIEKIINNLLSISFKNCYIADGSIIFNVTIDEPNKLLILRINNNKYYLNNEEQKLILASYYNASNTKGVINTDLSMSIVCGLVSRLNGDIDVQSDADCGTSFIVSLPLEYSIEQNNNNKDLNKHPSNSVEEYIYDIMFEEKSDSIAHLETTDNIQPDKHTILIVEDNASMNQLLYNKLNKYFKVITTYNGEEAMRELSNANVDLILSDITMPKLNGYELCNFVKSNKKYAHLHVILMTAHGSEETKLKSLKCGADSYMEKPLILEELIIRINNMLGVRKNIYEHYQSVLQFKFSSNVNNQEHQFIEKLSSFVVQNISDQTLNVEMLANYANMSKTLLYNKLKSAVNLSAMEFINSIRMNIAKEKIITTDLSIAEIAWQTGFNTPSYFSRAFKRHFGTAPNELRSKS
ncbi:MAG: response regulator [Rikenellaceae bacterium]